MMTQRRPEYWVGVCMSQPTTNTMQLTVKDRNSVWEEWEKAKPPLHISEHLTIKLQSYIQQSVMTLVVV